MSTLASAVDETTPRVEVRERLHLDHVDGLRALAALVVYVNHAYAQTWNPITGQFPRGFLSVFTYSLAFGHFAVAVFIAVSGFCLALPLVDSADRMRGGVVAFLKRRARRILPPYYAALVLCLGLIFTILGRPTGSLWDVPIQVDTTSIVSHFVLLQNVFGTGKINYVFWSIATEWHIYFLFPLFALGVRRLGVGKMVLAALASGYVVAWLAHGTRLERANPHFIGIFALGMAAAYVVRSPLPVFVRLRSQSFWPAASALLLALVVGSCFFVDVETLKQWSWLPDLAMGLFTVGVLVHATLHRSSRLTRFLGARSLVFIGTFSYSLYLLHAPLLQILWQYVLTPLSIAPQLQFALLMSVGLGVVLVAVFGFFKLFEEPFLNARPRPAAPQSAFSSSATTQR